MRIRHADPQRDAAACLEIYTPFITDGAASFEDEPPGIAEFRQRIERIARTHAYLVAEDAGRLAGFAYGGPYRVRAAYRWCTEVTIYLHPDFHRRGIGRAIYTQLLGLLERQGYRLALAAITVPNPGSVGLHRALGFEEVGTYRRVGWKAGAWRDVVWLERPLGPADDGRQPSLPGPPQRLAAPVELW